MGCASATEVPANTAADAVTATATDTAIRRTEHRDKATSCFQSRNRTFPMLGDGIGRPVLPLGRLAGHSDWVR
ncbi:hypothetical protein SZ00_03241 [Rhodococcus sp. AD45]|nr:hypothetical protein SZ00_03241 [Rhodococcus sp. AD45]